MPIPSLHTPINAYPHSASAAAVMLTSAFERIASDHGISQRRLAAHLGYANSVPLSHMASGRVPVPIDRTLDLAEATGICPKEFLLAVLDQRHPEIPFKSIFGLE
jgi:hypothetical protein